MSTRKEYQYTTKTTSKQLMNKQVLSSLSKNYAINYQQLQKVKEDPFGRTIFESLQLTDEQFINYVIKKNTTVNQFIDYYIALNKLAKYYHVELFLFNELMVRINCDLLLFVHDIEIIVKKAIEYDVLVDELPSVIDENEDKNWGLCYSLIQVLQWDYAIKFYKYNFISN